jgi:hypothetical protein
MLKPASDYNQSPHLVQPALPPPGVQDEQLAQKAAGASVLLSTNKDVSSWIVMRI